MKQKGQAALEFLVTYGWAILLILVMIGAIAYFGVLNPKDLAPERCVIGAEFSCDDFVVRMFDGSLARNEIAITLSNSLGKTVEVSKLYLECRDGCLNTHTRSDINCGRFVSTPDGANPFLVEPLSVRNGEQFFVSCNPQGGGSIRALDSNTNTRIYFAFNYTLQGGSIPHLVEGEIFAKPQE